MLGSWWLVYLSQQSTSQSVLCWLSVALTVNPHIHYMKQLKHRYCRCRPLIVTFVYYEFGTLSCATKLMKVPHFCTNYCRDWNCSPMISPGDIWTLITWHLSFWGCKRHQAARPDSLVLLCSAMKSARLRWNETFCYGPRKLKWDELAASFSRRLASCACCPYNNKYLWAFLRVTPPSCVAQPGVC